VSEAVLLCLHLSNLEEQRNQRPRGAANQVESELVQWLGKNSSFATLYLRSEQGAAL
jgi:hypothetical protein